MTVLIQTLTQAQPVRGSAWLPPRLSGFAAAAALMVLLGLADPVAGEIVLGSLADAYLQVSVFVAATLAVLLGLERGLGIDVVAVMQRHARWQVPLAALLGAVPGCGGAIVVTTQFVAGRLGFGALIAALTATMGDAAFLLLAHQPGTALGVFAIALAAGCITGAVVDGLHGRDFLRNTAAAPRRSAPADAASRPAALDRAWMALMVPGVVLGLPTTAGVDLAAYGIDGLAAAVGVAGAVLSLGMWAANGTGIGALTCGTPARRVIDDTNFVTGWVVLSYLLYDLGVHVTGVDPAGLFRGLAPLLPLMAVLVGLLPGCGPQILVTSLYLGGALPFSALLGNAISNDGDALFPALALAPRAALVATLYSAVPAVIVAYGWLALFE